MASFSIAGNFEPNVTLEKFLSKRTVRLRMKDNYYFTDV